ncbi:MAG: hypothetical protein LBS79_11770 [Tannerella sp.]|jgi:hypothetical protein|nr:hypothetical protein [Tannerella sp.]
MIWTVNETSTIETNRVTAKIRFFFLIHVLQTYFKRFLFPNFHFTIATVPFVPVMDLIAEGRTGIEALREKSAPYARKAWTVMSGAYREYPFTGAVVYYSLVQTGPANLLRPQVTGYRATMTGIPYDDLTNRRSIFSNQVHYILLRDKYSQTGILIEEKQALARQIRPVVENEMHLAEQFYQLAMEDPRTGFESSNHYFYVPNDLLEKIINYRQILDELNNHIKR